MMGAGLGLLGDGFDGPEVGAEVSADEVIVWGPIIAFDAPIGRH